MLKSVFEKKAEQMGDFYVYYQKRDSNVITFGICTTDFDNHHIKSKMRKIHVGANEVLMWNWRYDSPLKVSYDKIKKLTPLGAVLKNDR